MDNIYRNSQILKDNTKEFLYENGREDLLDSIPKYPKTTLNNNIEEIISILSKSGRPVEIAYIESFLK